MTVGSILLGVALFVIVGLYVFRPVLTPSHRPEIITKREALLAEKNALLNQIKTLDHDYETGKVPMDEYERDRARLKIAAANVLRQADTVPDSAENITAQIEAAIAALRNKSTGLRCGNCNAAIATDDKFCSSCGESL